MTTESIQNTRVHSSFIIRLNLKKYTVSALRICKFNILMKVGVFCLEYLISKHNRNHLYYLISNVFFLGHLSAIQDVIHAPPLKDFKMDFPCRESDFHMESSINSI